MRAIRLDREELCRELAALVEAPDVHAGLAVLTRDYACMAGLTRPGRTRASRRLPGLVDDPRVVEANRTRLAQRHRESPLNLLLTTTFANEVTAILLYRAFADAMAFAPFEAGTRERMATRLEELLAEQSLGAGVLHEHCTLLAAPRAGLSEDAREALEYLEMLSAADYEFPACLAVAEAATNLASFAELDAANASRGRAASRFGAGPAGVKACRPGSAREELNASSH